jgi:predicted ATPase
MAEFVPDKPFVSKPTREDLRIAQQRAQELSQQFAQSQPTSPLLDLLSRGLFGGPEGMTLQESIQRREVQAAQNQVRDLLGQLFQAAPAQFRPNDVVQGPVPSPRILGK